MTSQHNALRHLVQSRLDELGIGAREAHRRSGGEVSYESIRNIIQGRHSGRVKDQTAEGLARALEVPVSRVYEAAGSTVPEPWEWPSRFNRLTPRQRQIVEQVASGFLEANEKGGGS